MWSPLWGNDANNFIIQALPFKLFDTIKFAFPDGAALETLIPLGKTMPEGVFVASRYFFLTPDAAMNRKFVSAYLDRFKEYPDYMAEETYAGVYFLKAAIERAQTLDADKIIMAVEKGTSRMGNAGGVEVHTQRGPSGRGRRSVGRDRIQRKIRLLRS